MDITEFSMPVHKSFQQQDLILGLKKPVFLIVFLVFVLMAYLFKAWIGFAAAAVIYIPARILTNIDPDMLEIALSSLTEPDRLEG